MPHILIVDDRKEDRYILQSSLESQGFQVTSAKDGAEALETARSNPPDLILSDIFMPVMDGFELCRQWRSDEQLRLIPFVFVTATYKEIDEEGLGLALGAVSYVHKPIETSALITIIEQSLAATEPPELESRRDATELLLAHNKAITRKLDEYQAASKESTANQPATEKRLRDSEASRKMLLSILEDQKLTEDALRRSEEKLRELNSSLELRVAERSRELQQANQELEAYARSVAHDLRAPLRAMFGFAVALREDYGDQLDARAREYTGFIESGAHQMDQLISDLLEYSKVGQSKMSVKTVDLDDVVARSLQALNAETTERQAVITVESPLGLGTGHRVPLVQVLSNLISNGMKFVAKGVTPRIRIWREQRGEQLRLWVSDNGIGIDPEHQSKIFRVFERLHGIETYPGTGIGLAIVRRAVETNGGSFGVESEVGQGSRFWVEIPAHAPGTSVHEGGPQPRNGPQER